MKNSYSTLLVFFLLIAFANAQKSKEKDYTKEDEKINNKLSAIFDKDKFADCIDASDSYITDEKTSRSPFPYLFSSMSYFAIYNDQENFDMKKFKDPLRKAISFMGRFKKKDKSGEVQKENSEFLSNLQNAVLSECASLKDKKDLRSLQNLSRDIAKNYDKDAAMLIISGVYLCSSDVKPEGEKNIESGMNFLKKRKADNDTKFDSEESGTLSKAFVLYTDYLSTGKDPVKTKEVMQFASDILPDNDAIKKQSEKIMN